MVDVSMTGWLNAKEVHTRQVVASGDALRRLVVSGEPQALQRRAGSGGRMSAGRSGEFRGRKGGHYQVGLIGASVRVGLTGRVGWWVQPMKK
jgi:hypothetical protein